MTRGERIVVACLAAVSWSGVVVLAVIAPWAMIGPLFPAFGYTAILISDGKTK